MCCILTTTQEIFLRFNLPPTHELSKNFIPELVKNELSRKGDSVERLVNEEVSQFGRVINYPYNIKIISTNPVPQVDITQYLISEETTLIPNVKMVKSGAMVAFSR